MDYGISKRELAELISYKGEQLEARVLSTRCAFRVFDDQSQGSYDEQNGFVAGAVLHGTIPYQPPTKPEFYDTVTSHIDWREIPSPWISASRRWDWAIWEMQHRNECIPGTDARVAVIDFAAVSRELRSYADSESSLRLESPIHALQYLRSDYTKATKLKYFSNVADEILFYRCIPACAVISVIRFQDIALSIPGRGSGRPQNPGFRAAHHHIFTDDLLSSFWSPKLYAFQCFNRAYATLRPLYTRTLKLVMLLLLEGLATSFPVPMVPNWPTSSPEDTGLDRTAAVELLEKELRGLFLQRHHDQDIPPTTRDILVGVSIERVVATDRDSEVGYDDQVSESLPFTKCCPPNPEKHVFDSKTLAYRQLIYIFTEWATQSRYSKLGQILPNIVSSIGELQNVSEMANNKSAQLWRARLNEKFFQELSSYTVIEEVFNPLLHIMVDSTEKNALSKTPKGLWATIKRAGGRTFKTEKIEALVSKRRPLLAFDRSSARIEPAYQAFWYLQAHLLSLAHSLPFSYLGGIKAEGWAEFKHCVSEMTRCRLLLLSEALELFDCPESTSGSLEHLDWWKAENFEVAAQLFQP